MYFNVGPPTGALPIIEGMIEPDLYSAIPSRSWRSATTGNEKQKTIKLLS